MNNPQQFPTEGPEFRPLLPSTPSYNAMPHNAHTITAHSEPEQTFFKERLTTLAVYPTEPAGKEKSRHIWAQIGLGFCVLLGLTGLGTAFSESVSVSDFIANILLSFAFLIPATWGLTARIYNRRVIKKWQEVEQQRRRILTNLLPEEAAIGAYLHPEPLPMVYRKRTGLAIGIFFALMLLSAFFIGDTPA